MHKNQLCPSLGHPDNLLQLEALCQEESKRQKDQADAIHLNTETLRVTIKPWLNTSLIDVAFGKKRFWIVFFLCIKSKLKNVFSFSVHTVSLSYVSAARVYWTQFNVCINACVHVQAHRLVGDLTDLLYHSEHEKVMTSLLLVLLDISLHLE